MKAISRAGKIIFASLIFIMAIFIGNEKVFAAEVSDFNGLKQAIENGTDDINVQGTINVTEILTIRRDVKISGGGLKASNLATEEPESGNIFYVEEGKNFELENITLDGDKKARVIYSNGGILKITNSTIKNGYPGANAKANPGGGIFLKGGSLEAKDTNFIGNTPGTNTTLPKGDGDLNGGAIYSGSTKADITITGGKFENNEVKAYGHGAAIYQENGILNVTGTSFKNNKGHVEGGNAGTQGSCIHTRDQVKATISGVTAEIAKGFNTGGFLRSWKSDVTVTDSKFTINGLGDGYGYSGGALCFEGGTSKVEKSEFTCTGSKLFHAGGFIDIVGTGTHVIDGNKMTGAGKENGQQIASFGGAISVEEGAKATVTINDNTIKDVSASDNGGAIAIGTHKGKSTPSTVTMSGNTISNAGTLFWGAQYGGGVFVAPDATVTMTKDTIKDTRSSYGGGIYNEGNLTITDGSSLTGGVGSKLGGEIYNNGELIVDDATITGSFVGGAAWQQYASHGKNYELGGTNIYAEKDVTITPKANITTGKDVRVLDGQSKILLTGALNKEIDVSISEIAGGSEKPNRRVGYVIAEGKGGYVATKSDAKFLHYIGRTNKEDASHYSNQPRAAFADDKSTGEWDFVLDKDNKKVVLGQRVKLIYHGNLGKFGENDSEEKTVDVYKNPSFWENQLEEYKVADPKLEGSSFMGWYFWKSGDSVEDTDDSIQNIKIPDDLREKLFDFSRVNFQNNVKDTDQIITPNIIHTYAGWSQNISIPVLKDWGDTKDTDKVDVTVTLKGGDEEKTLTLTKAGNYVDQFEDLKVFTKSYEGEKKNMNLKFTPIEYSVEETPIAGFTTSYLPQSMKANEVAEVSRFVVTNKKTFKVTYEFKSGTEGKTLPAAINGFKPTDTTEYADGATVNAKQPTQKT
ncbi:MAG: SHIRT domain-containing protein, partial [Peptoniphilus grossensis]